MFQELYIPQNIPSTRIMSFSGGWLSLLPAFTSLRKLLDDSILALYCGFIGRQNNDPALIYHGMELYGEVLQTIGRNQSLSAESDLKDIESLLATIIILTRYEVLSTNNGEGYPLHIRGGLHILQRSIHKLPKTWFSKVPIQNFRYLGVGIPRPIDCVRCINIICVVL
jgi:hypothetical protein